MIIEILIKYKKWNAGDKVDVTASLGKELCALGIAKSALDQARFDVRPKVEADKEDEKNITINNYFLAEDKEASDNIDNASKAKKDKGKKNDSQTLK